MVSTALLGRVWLKVGHSVCRLPYDRFLVKHGLCNCPCACRAVGETSLPAGLLIPPPLGRTPVTFYMTQGHITEVLLQEKFRPPSSPHLLPCLASRCGWCGGGADTILKCADELEPVFEDKPVVEKTAAKAFVLGSVVPHIGGAPCRWYPMWVVPHDSPPVDQRGLDGSRETEQFSLPVW